MRPLAALVVLAGLLPLAACGDGGAHSNDDDAGGGHHMVHDLHPSLLVAVLIPEEPHLDQMVQPTMELHVLSADGATTIARGEPWVAVSLSPSGTHVTALRLDLQALHVHREANPVIDIFDIDRGGHIEILLPRGTMLQPSRAPDGIPSWSPDGELIALSASGATFIYTTDGNEVASVGHTVNRTHIHGMPTWSPDGAYLAATAGSRLAVIDRRGNVVAQDDVDSILATVGLGRDEAPLFIDSWDQGNIVVSGFSGSSHSNTAWEFRGAISDVGIEWEAVQGDGIPAHVPGGLGLHWISQQTLPAPNHRPALARETVSGLPGGLVYWHPDERARITVGDLSGGARSTLLVEAGGRLNRADIDLGLDAQLFAVSVLEYLWDAVLME